MFHWLEELLEFILWLLRRRHEVPAPSKLHVQVTVPAPSAVHVEVIG